jgi:hypothetical protein
MTYTLTMAYTLTMSVQDWVMGDDIVPSCGVDKVVRLQKYIQVPDISIRVGWWMLYFHCLPNI